MDGERGYPWHLPPALALHLEILRYPILARRIRERMRQELFARGIITPEAFEAEVREKALSPSAWRGSPIPSARSRRRNGRSGWPRSGTS